MGASAIDFWVWPIPEKKKQGIDDLNKILSGGTQQMFFDLTVSILRSRITTFTARRIMGSQVTGGLEILHKHPSCEKQSQTFTPLFWRVQPLILSCKFQGGKWIINAKAVEWYYIQGFTSPGSKWVRAFGPFWNKKGQCGTSKPSTRRIILTLTLAEFDFALYLTTDVRLLSFQSC